MQAERDKVHAEEKRLDDCLEKIDEIVVPPDVSELVREEHVELNWCQSRDETRRNDDYWTNCANNEWNVDCR